MANIETLKVDTFNFAEGSAPSTPSSGQMVVYGKTDGRLYLKNDAGTEVGLINPVPWALVPDTGVTVTEVSIAGAANRAFVIPALLIADATITGVRIGVGTSSGNISVGLYDSALARVATSGAVACPATGAQNVNFSGSYSAVAGRYYIGLSVDNNTATFRMSQTTTIALGPMHAFFMETAHPLPSTFTSAGASRTPAMIGLISGGWTA